MPDQKKYAPVLYTVTLLTFFPAPARDSAAHSCVRLVSDVSARTVDGLLSGRARRVAPCRRQRRRVHIQAWAATTAASDVPLAAEMSV